MIENSKVYIYYPFKQVSGINVIIENLIKFSNMEVVYVSNIENIPQKVNIIPYGVVAAINLINSGYKTNVCFLVDSPSLCHKSVVKFYITKKVFFLSEIIRNSLLYLKMRFLEKKIFRNYQNIIVVSPHDKRYLDKTYKVNCMCIPNGVILQENIPKSFVNNDDKVVFGVLSHWGEGAFNDLKWFIDHYYQLILFENPKIEILIAGRGATLKMIEFWSAQKNIRYIGETDKLSDFFSEIDIFLCTVRKECGILNKVLDAWAYSTFVFGLPQNFLAFPDLDKGFRCFNSVKEFNVILNEYINNKESLDSELLDSKEYIRKNHSWEKNYEKISLLFYDKLDSAE